MKIRLVDLLLVAMFLAYVGVLISSIRAQEVWWSSPIGMVINTFTAICFLVGVAILWIDNRR